MRYFKPTKGTFILFLHLFTTSFVFGQNDDHVIPFTIEGNIRHFGNGMLIGTITDLTNHLIRLDTIVVQHGSFKHYGEIRERQVIRYMAAGDKFAKFRKLLKDGDTVLIDLAEDKPRSLEVVAFPGATIKVSGVAGAYLDAYPSGTPENEQLSALNGKIYPLLNEIGNIKINYSKRTYDSLSKRENALLAEISDIESGFIISHPSSIVTSCLVFEKFKSWNEKAPAKADSLYQLVRPLEEDVYQRQMLALKKKRTKRNIGIGDTFPLFTTKLTYKSDGFDLQQTRGKYTLIDFWGSWCVPCVREMPRLKEYHEKFRDRLNIVGIANDKYQDWKAFLDKYSYPWMQVLDQEIPKVSDILNVKVYPTKYLLDPDGKIIMIFRDANDEVWKALNDLFKST